MHAADFAGVAAQLTLAKAEVRLAFNTLFGTKRSDS
jgi:hypothetical protein